MSVPSAEDRARLIGGLHAAERDSGRYAGSELAEKWERWLQEREAEREALIRTVLEVVTDEHVGAAGFGPEGEDWNDHACAQWNKLVRAVRPYQSPTTPKAQP